MELTPTLNLVTKAYDEGYAVPSFCVWNADVIKTVLDVAEELSAPVILMNGWAEFLLLDPGSIGRIIHSLIQNHCTPVALHLDHGTSIEEVKTGLSSGYTSVMLDYSTKSFIENTNALKKVVKLSHPLGVSVEGELGAVGRTEIHAIEGSRVSSLTDPRDAEKFVAETGIDMLAVSIGNAHGMYTALPNLDFGLLGEIRNLVKIPLVLHGGSGTPENDLKKAVKMGVAKVNVASELVQTVRLSLMKQWSAGHNFYTPIALADAMKELSHVVRKWIKLAGADGNA
jgi:fructose-bisphosphate aldolase class II